MMKRILAICLAIILATCMVFVSSASSLNDAQSELKQTQKEINALRNKKKQERQTLLNNEKVRNEIIDNLQQKGLARSEIEAKIAEIESAINSLNEAIRLAEGEYADQLELFQTRLVSLYINSKTKAEASVLLQCEDFEQMFKKKQMMNLVSQFDQGLLNDIEEKQKEINQLKALKHQEEDTAQQQLEQMLTSINELEVSRASVDSKVKENEQFLKQLDKAEDELEAESKELEKLIKRLSTSGAYTGGVMQWPLPGYYKISSYFGMRMHPILKYNKMHGGIDIGAPNYTPIHAAASGKVICAAWRSGGSGNTVIIDHGGGITTLYFHIIKGGILVKEGQIVSAGDVIAKVGSTGLSTGPHLHFEVRKNGVRQDPLGYVTSQKK